MSNDQLKLLSDSDATRALSDLNFFTVLPEYSSLRVKMQAMKADLTQSTQSCGSCRARRVVRTLFSDFMAVTLALSEDGITRLKQYFGVTAFLVNYMEPSTGRVTIKRI